jgi:hypothetical protein
MILRPGSGQGDEDVTELIVPLHSRRRARLGVGQKLQHVIAGGTLFLSGVQSLSSGAEGLERALAVAGMATAALLFAAFVRSLRPATGRAAHAAHASHGHGVDWVDIFAAGVLFAEAAEKWHSRGHIWRPETLAALATLGIGLFHGRLAARKERQRSLRVNGEGVVVRRRFFGSFTSTWRDLAEITLTDREAVLRRRDGKQRRLNLADLENASDVRAALEQARRQIAERA